jgi:imidazolonepropionase-like amidohydrolase
MPDGHIPPASDGRKIWLRVGAVFDGVAPRPMHGAHVLYDATAILYVGPSDRPPPPEVRDPAQREPDLDLEEYTLVPGLIEAHAHLYLAGGELDPARRAAARTQSSDARLDAARQRLDRLARLGIAAVRDAGDRLGVGLALSALSRREPRPPTSAVESPGAAIHHRGRYGGFMAEPVEAHASPRDCVQARVRLGADRIKLITTGVVDFEAGRMDGEPQMSAAEVSAFVEAAREFDMPTFAHASGEDGIRHAIDGGVGSVEHGYFVCAADLSRMRDLQIAWTPTLAPVRAQLDHADRLGWSDRAVSNLRAILDRHAAQLRHAHELGVPITAGSDAGSLGVPHGYGLLDELELMEEAGMPPAAVLAAATGNAAGHLRLRERWGRIERGCPSRFILTRHSPLNRIANLRRERTVVFDGTAHDCPPGVDAAGL